MDMFKPWDIKIPGGITPHSCTHCETITVTYITPTVTQRLSFTFEEVCRAAQDGCKLFQIRLNKLTWPCDLGLLQASKLNMDFNTEGPGPPFSCQFWWSYGKEPLFDDDSDEKPLDVFALNGIHLALERNSRLSFH